MRTPEGTEFLSTPSARRATHSRCQTRQYEDKFLSTPSARRATTFASPSFFWTVFLSTPSARRATPRVSHIGSESKDFYPRPLRGGRLFYEVVKPRKVHFYPRPLRGGRRCSRTLRRTVCQFLSTPSARRATGRGCRPAEHIMISIHALCEEGDFCQKLHRTISEYFYPRPLRGGRPWRLLWHNLSMTISIHALCEEGDKSKSGH